MGSFARWAPRPSLGAEAGAMMPADTPKPGPPATHRRPAAGSVTAGRRSTGQASGAAAPRPDQSSRGAVARPRGTGARRSGGSCLTRTEARTPALRDTERLAEAGIEPATDRERRAGAAHAPPAAIPLTWRASEPAGSPAQPPRAPQPFRAQPSPARGVPVSHTHRCLLWSPLYTRKSAGPSGPFAA